ncbi:hypothetical protein AEQU2_02926 [Aequorivita lipolytica]|nr:hypothetical protein AEQU2_02926 [Aequorivita lipolytica]
MDIDKNIISHPVPNFALFSVKKLLGNRLKLFITNPIKPITRKRIPNEKYLSIEIFL